MQVIRRSAPEEVQDLLYDVYEEEREEDKEEGGESWVSPKIKLMVCQISIDALIYSGSEITCVSQAFYERLVKLDVPEFPVANIKVSVAIGAKTTMIKKQLSL